MKAIMTTAVLVSALLWPVCASALPPPSIRVLIEEGARAQIRGIETPIEISFGDEIRPSRRTAGGGAAISAGTGGLLFHGEDIGRKARLINRTRRYEVSGKVLRGEIVVLWTSERRMIVVNVVPLEEYLVGLVGSEMYPGWPMEAYKAQAIAARTYALHHSDAASRTRDYDVTSTVLSQVYEGVNREAARARDAVDATRGLVLMRGGSIFPAYYHSCCGGATEHAHNVWEGEEGPPQVKDRYCENSPKRIWSEKISIDELKRTLAVKGIATGRIRAISTEYEDDSPRAETLILEHDRGTERIKATDLRAMFGYSRVKSTWFDATLEGDAVLFSGRGYGHGVGMCQWGAKGMAEEGASYDSILRFYYADAQIMKAY